MLPSGGTDATGVVVNNPDVSVPLRVLLVDDEQQQLELRASILRRAGFSVLTACGPREALSLGASIGQCDIAIVDYDMPIINGGVLAEHLKGKFPGLNIVLYSAALTIPSHCLKDIDAFIHKGEGVVVLLQHLWNVSAQIAGRRQRSDPTSHYGTAKSPPNPEPTESKSFPAVLAAGNVA